MALELAFETKALRDICESKATAEEKLGAKVADALKRRPSDFQSIDTFDELPFTKPRKNSNNVSFNLPDGWRLIVTGGHGEKPRSSTAPPSSCRRRIYAGYPPCECRFRASLPGHALSIPEEK